MSLDLLKERLGSSVSTNKKEVDKEKLNEIFNSNPMENLESFKSQHKRELEEKDRIIKNLETQTSELATEVLELEIDNKILDHKAITSSLTFVKLIFNPAGQPSIIPPREGPWDSPKVVNVNMLPNEFPAIM